MKISLWKTGTVAILSCMLVVPAYGRGIGGRGMGGGGGRFGGGMSGGMRSSEMGRMRGGGNAFRGQGQSMGRRGFGGVGQERQFGGGFSSLGESRPMARPGGEQGFANRGMGGFQNRGFENNAFQNRGLENGFANRGFENGAFENRGAFGNNSFGRGFNQADHLPTEGGFGGIAGLKNRAPNKIGDNDLHNQGNQIRNSFNNNQFNNANVNVNRYGGYGGYGGYGSGWAHGYAASNAYHGYWGYPGAWSCPGWAQATAWTCMGLTTLTSFLGMGMMASGSRQSSPSNVTYQGDTVYINGQPTASQEQYYQQALNLAYQNAPGAQPYQSAYAPASGNNANFAPAQVNPAGPADENSLASGSAEEWQPLGVFALAEPSQTDSNMLLQLAINKQGNVRGNYMNQLTNERSQVFGSLDKQTQRLSWRIGDNSSTVFDTSLNDIVKDDSQVLVHYGPTNTREMALIRLNGPANQSPGDGNSLPAQGTSVGPSG